MKEKIILAPGINGGELMSNLALSNVNCFNIRVCGAGELARIALMRSGISVTDTFISTKDEDSLVSQAAENELYFEKASYSDIHNLAMAIRKMRCLIVDDDETFKLEEIMKRGIFTEKNAAIISVYNTYMKILSDNKMIDYVAVIRKAIRECDHIESEFFVLSECCLNPLERALLNKVSDGKFTEISIRELYGAKETNIKIESIHNCYGTPNEVEYVLTEIYRYNKRLDHCTVALADVKEYAQLFFDMVMLNDVPITFGCGIPVINSNPGKLLVLYYRWMTSGFYGRDAMMEMLRSNTFNSKTLYDFLEIPEEFDKRLFYEIIGGMRLTDDLNTNILGVNRYKKALLKEEELVDKNDIDAREKLRKKKSCIPYIEAIAKELALPVEEFISKYAYIRRSSGNYAERLLMMLDNSASNAIYESLCKIRKDEMGQSKTDIILNTLKINVCNQRSEAGKLHVTGIVGAISSVRDNLYIMGLSASKFPGMPRENYLLLDDDLKLFGESASNYTSEGNIRKKVSQLFDLVSLASGIGAKTYISYSGLNVSELKSDNASSVIFELYSREKGENITLKELEDQIIKVDYFEPEISVTRGIGRAYNNGQMIVANTSKAPYGVSKGAASWLDNEFSPTALDTFFKCNRKFMLKYMFQVSVPERKNDFEVISPNEAGVLAHSLMETLSNSTMSINEFVELSGEYFDMYIAENPPLISKNADIEKEKFTEMMRIAFDMDPRRETVLEEEDIHCSHESGVKLRGFPDRVEKLEDGSYLIVDFKSGQNIVHIQDDIDTCLQVVIYAYLMEQKGYRVKGAQYRYLRLGEIITCKYDSEMKELLSDRLLEFKQHLLSGDFPVAEEGEDGEDPCKYCEYSMVCGKNQEEV